jgi:hypothetical protein
MRVSRFGGMGFRRKATVKTVTVDELKAHNPSLRELNLWFRNNCQPMGIAVEVLYETQPTSGVTVVDPTSADPGIAGLIPIPIDADHITICKPDSQSHRVYARVNLFIRRLIGGRVEDGAQ